MLATIEPDTECGPIMRGECGRIIAAEKDNFFWEPIFWRKLKRWDLVSEVSV
jgi:hypothetical protein